MKSSINVNLVKTEEIVNVAFQLNEIGTALATFIGQTEKVVQNARVSFDDADKESAKFFG